MRINWREGLTRFGDGVAGIWVLLVALFAWSVADFDETESLKQAGGLFVLGGLLVAAVFRLLIAGLVWVLQGFGVGDPESPPLPSESTSASASFPSPEPPSQPGDIRDEAEADFVDRIADLAILEESIEEGMPEEDALETLGN